MYDREHSGHMLTRQALRLIATLWIAGLVVVSLQPWRPEGESQSIVHQVLHLVSFGAAGLMLFALSRNSKQIRTAALAVFCLAVVIETSQHMLYKNAFEWWDVRDDTIGVLLGGILIRWTRIRSLLLKTGD
jgi:VanZ family protein